MSPGRVILMLRSLPSTTQAYFDIQPLHEAGLVGADKAVVARGFEGADQQIVANAWGVWASTRRSRCKVERTRARPLARLTCFTVSTGTTPTIAAPVVAASSSTLSMISGSIKGRTAS